MTVAEPMVTPGSEHILDNPVYNAMISNNRQLSSGTGTIRYFPVEIGPFAGLHTYDTESLSLLAEMLPPERVVAIVTPEPVKIPSAWKLLQQESLFQMVWHLPSLHTGKSAQELPQFIPLTRDHVPRMIELTKTTNPGPFNDRTIEFGNFFGIFASGRLIAMAGHRLHPDKYVEISAICTSPGHTGKGLARALIDYQTQRIIRNGETPFLHVRASNQRAISVYESSGFIKRRQMVFTIIQNTF